MFGILAKRTAIHVESSTRNPDRIFGYRLGQKIPTKKALLAYLPNHIFDKLDGKKTIRFSNEGIARGWVNVLAAMGYATDIVGWNDKTFKPSAVYDLVIFHGGQNFKKITPILSGQPKIIHFSTGSHWLFNNKQEDQRLLDFKNRKSVRADRDRYIKESEDPVNDSSDGIIVIGNRHTAETYPDKYKVIPISIGSYPDNHFKKINKDYSLARQNFLFFAGAGNIHKGLDLIIEAFAQTKLNLYIVTVLDKHVLAQYKKELALPNIHLIGELGMRSPEFYSLADKCAYVIMASCSEGQAGSIVEGMTQGLIPVITKESGIDIKDYGFEINNVSVQEIKKLIIGLSKTQPHILKSMSLKAYKTALINHSPKVFEKNLKRAISKIIKA